MRKGTAIKQAISTTLMKTWVASGREPINLTVRFAGTGASMMHENSGGIIVNLPDFKDDHAYGDEHADRIVAMALHELGHAFFTDSVKWTSAVRMNGSSHELHRCINAFEDVRMERALITSGYATGAEKLLTVLLRHMVAGCDVDTFKRKENIAFAICVDGRGYGINVLPLVAPEFRALVSEGISRCAALVKTEDAIKAGIWLWQALKTLKNPPPPDDGEEGDDGEGEKGDGDEGEGEKGDDGDGDEGEKGDGEKGDGEGGEGGEGEGGEGEGGEGEGGEGEGGDGEGGFA
jgi:hypothetical protein